MTHQINPETLKRIERAAEALKSEYAAKRSNAVLVQEYLRRAAILLDSCGVGPTKPFFKPSILLFADKAIAIPDVAEVVPASKLISNPFHLHILQCCLDWSYLVEYGVQEAVDFKDLYHPLLRAVERGATIDLHHGEILVDGYGLPMATWRQWATKPERDISDDNLQKLDQT